MTIETFQSEWELAQLVSLVERLSPRRILEIGAWHGGTLWHWLQIADEVTVIDDEMRMANDWIRWTKGAGAYIHLLKGRSQERRIVKAVQIQASFDFLYIDGDHTAEAVRADWENYGPLADVVAFHDILPREGYGVSELWQELKSAPGARYMEIIHNEVSPGAEGKCGTGVLWRS